MPRKQFTKEQKLKYINISLNQGIEYAMIQFVEDFWECRYKETYIARTKKKNVNPFHRAKCNIKKWIKIYNTDMNNLESKTGKSPKKGKGSGRPKRTSINDLNEHDRDLYQEIMEEILNDHGISPKIIIEKIKQKKEQNKSFENQKAAAEVLKINRTSIYTSYKKEEKIGSKNQHINENIIEWINNEITLSKGILGRDKLFHKYINEIDSNISSYVFRINYEFIGHKSTAYKRNKKDKPPREEKSRSVWTPDLVNGNFESSYFGEVWHADIKYVKVNGKWQYLHVITETYSQAILVWELSEERTAESTIKLVKRCIEKFGIIPKIFHTDHGIEYANYMFSDFLKNLGILQSMSPKGNSLRNRPSEYLFAIFQRELFDFYETSNMNYEIVYNLVTLFVNWYNTKRPQRNLEYKTPYAISKHMMLCV
ncbi:DDE-type integrase/transposase/recombinase [Mycoplasma seminis]|uniref:DDE-type integrase/transposase/recombinase n=1 Tax=Mycoplasma seminis TaxID=512749 RepID=A0ABY9HAF9_9MOLU|nr:DDE-type integrase/transposase/recombinase [Mycoplasma seminis]WLP85582.1 DDE-type integrase/transposase/recombinase [Mycoplasma seminis]